MLGLTLREEFRGKRLKGHPAAPEFWLTWRWLVSPVIDHDGNF